MSTTFNKYIKQLMREMDVASCDQHDIQEELMLHLELSKKQFIQSGLDEKSAEKQAIKQFGNPEDIGEEIQEAMFPGRRMLLLFTAYLSLFYSFFAYSCQLFLEGNAAYIWLILSVFISSCLWFIANHVQHILRLRFVRVTIHIFHILTYTYGSFALSSIDSPISYFSIIAWLLALLSIIAIYQLVIYDYRHDQQVVSKQIIVLHVINVTVGLIYGAALLFFLWSAFAFSEGFSLFAQWRLYVFLATMVVWIICYYMQIKYVHKTKFVYLLFIVPILYIYAVILFI